MDIEYAGICSNLSGNILPKSRLSASTSRRIFKACDHIESKEPQTAVSA